MAITDILFPQGNFLNIRANAPSQTDYNIQATSDLVNQLPGGIVRDVVAPAAAFGMSLPYDAIQGAARITEDDISRAMMSGALTPRDIASEAFGLSYSRENPLSSAVERFMGASQPLSNRLSNMNIGTSAQAEPLNVEDYLGTSTPTEVAIKAAPQVFNPQADYGQFFRPQPVVDRNLFTPVMEKFAAARQGLGSLKDRAIDFGTKGIDLGKMVGRGILNAVIPGAGLFIDAFKTTPEGTAMKDFYGNLYGLDPIGRIASGPMKGYAPGDTLFGSPGLTNSINQRIARIKKTLEKKKSVQLEQRLKALEELKKKESEISSQVLESKRTGRRPSAPSGGGGVRDSGGPTGGYSYDSGGREGFGYGLKNGGIVDLL